MPDPQPNKRKTCVDWLKSGVSLVCFKNQSIMLKNSISTDKAQSFIFPLIFYVNKIPFILNIFMPAYPFRFEHFQRRKVPEFLNSTKHTLLQIDLTEFLEKYPIEGSAL